MLAIDGRNRVLQQADLGRVISKDLSDKLFINFWNLIIVQGYDMSNIELIKRGRPGSESSRLINICHF
jgi:hypothetical protein